MSLPEEGLAEWLKSVGRDRARLWRIIESEDPFENMVSKGFLVTGLGNTFATAKVAEIKFRAQKAKGSLFDYLSRVCDEGKLEQLLNDVDVKNPIIVGAVRGLVDVEKELRLREGADKNKMSKLYEKLKEIKGIGDKIRHYIVYDLVRIYNYPLPDNLGPYNELLEKLRKLGIKNPERSIKSEDWPYIDAAVWDLEI